MGIYKYRALKRAHQARGFYMPKKTVPAPVAEKDRREWVIIAAVVVALGVLGVTYQIGHRQGFKQGESATLDYMMQKIHDNLDQPCFDQLANSLAKKEDQ
jgi:hypothetical protein